jgi:hypothetical protein
VLFGLVNLVHEFSTNPSDFCGRRYELLLCGESGIDFCFILVFWSEREKAAMSDEENKEEKELDLSSPDVVTKYKCAAEIANSEKKIKIKFPPHFPHLPKPFLSHSTPLGYCLRFSFVLDRFLKFFDSVILGIMRMKYHKGVKGMMGSRQKAAMECKDLLVWWPFSIWGSCVV